MIDEALVQRAVKALERIADALDAAIAVPVPPATAPCEHPMEARVDFGGMGELGGYQCTACGAHVEPEKVNAHV